MRFKAALSQKADAGQCNEKGAHHAAQLEHVPKRAVVSRGAIKGRAVEVDGWAVPLTHIRVVLQPPVQYRPREAQMASERMHRRQSPSGGLSVSRRHQPYEDVGCMHAAKLEDTADCCMKPTHLG